ncbi:MAG: HEAT repeat domain-containing protein [Planctomycetes bacterium]|nr:HEAT repeat domain-containing protein [Planctomycetota bacterium]
MTRRLLLLLALAAAPLARADLDVGVPPGTPLEWDLPQRRPTSSLRVPEPEGPPPDGPGTRERGRLETRARPAVTPERVTPMGYARITTFDILGHIDWRGPEPQDRDLRPATAPGRARTGGGREGPETAAAYPPPVPADLYWLTFAFLLRELMHPMLVSRPETLERLVELGPPALAVLVDLEQQPLQGKGVLEAWVRAVSPRIAPLPRARPRALASDDPREAMLLRLAADELAAGWPHALAPFAPRLLALPPEEAVPLLARYATEGGHPLLRQNAAALLGGYRGPGVVAALERAARDPDGVTRLRACLALGRTGSEEARKAVLERARDLGPTAVFLLGALRAPDGVDLGVRLLRGGAVDDALVALPALGRMGVASREATRALDQALGALERTKPEAFFTPPVYQPDVPDPVDARRTVLLQLCRLAQARLGDEQARADVLRLLAATPEPPERGFRRAPVAAPTTFGAFLVPTLAVVVETLERMGEDGRARLRVVARDALCEPALRLAALSALARLRDEHLEAVLDALVLDPEALVQAAALEALAARAPARALERARTVIGGGPRSGAVAVVAARLLGAAGERPATAWPCPGEVRGGASVRAGEELGAAVLLRPRHGLRAVVLGEAGDLTRPLYRVQVGGVEGFVLRNAVTLLPRRGTTTTDQLAAALDTWVRARRTAPAPQAPARSGGGVVEAPAPVIETLLLELGRVGTPQAEGVLRAHLADAAAPERWAAAIALGRFGTPAALRALAEALGDADGWVRYCAYRGLLHTAGREGLDVFADWLYGAAADRAEATLALRAWAEGRR